MKNRTSTNFWIDVVSLAVMLGLAVTGGLIHYVLPPGRGHFYELLGWKRHDIGQLHFYFAVAAVALLALHLLLHWSWICCFVAKAVGREVPSRRAQTVWGLSSLLGVTVLLIGGLWWTSKLVRLTAQVTGGSDSPLSRSALSSGTVREAVAPQVNPSQSAPPPENRADGEQHNSREAHAQDCPAAAAIDGRTSLAQAAKLCRLNVAQLIEKLKLPAGTDPEAHLGRLKRSYGLDLHAVRVLACP
jgi:hypothetical protein